MKRLLTLFVAVCAVLSGYAQKTGDSSIEEVRARIASINQQIDILKNDIHSEYQKYSEKKTYSDEKIRDRSFAELQTESDNLRTQIISLSHVIDSLKEEYKVVDKLREYYLGDVDSLFSHADKESLAIDKRILGEDYPKVIDELQILIGCREILNKKYDSERQSSELWKLEEVRSCNTKENLSKLLSLQKDITAEVEYWIKNEEHSLYDYVMFRNYLSEYYSVSLDEDLPYLTGMVLEKIEWTAADY